jgi:hypothetical protein
MVISAVNSHNVLTNPIKEVKMSKEIMTDSSIKISKAAACPAKVLESTILNQCSCSQHIPMGRIGPMVCKLPVVLSNIEVQIDMESETKLEGSSTSIETIDNNIFLTQCKHIPCTEKLFISGYLRKSLQYAVLKADASAGSTIKHAAVDIPFKCTTLIQFSRKAIYGKQSRRKLEILGENKLGKDSAEETWTYYNTPQEPVYCELQSAKLTETHSINHDCTSEDSKEPQICLWKLTMALRLLVLQKQLVYIGEPEGDVTLLENYNPDLDYQDSKFKTEKYSEIEVGFDPKNGMIGRIADKY